MTRHSTAEQAARGHGQRCSDGEVAPGQFDAVLRLGGPWRNSTDAHRAVRWLTDTLTQLLPGPPHAVSERNPRPLLIRPIPAPARKAASASAGRQPEYSPPQLHTKEKR